MKGFERTPSFLSAAAFVGVALAGLVLMTAAGCAGLPTDALAQTYPAKPVKFVVSFPPAARSTSSLGRSPSA